MNELARIYGSTLVALGCWATFTTWRTLRSREWRARRGELGLLGIVFVASCFLPGFALLAGRLESWMVLPLGACFVALIPYPCYFKRANRGRIRTARSLLFLLVGAGLIGAGLGVLPVSWFGL